MSIEAIPTEIDGCYELRPQVRADARGTFVKTFHREWFEELGLQADWAEQYYSVSRKGVLRGLHFQLPPHDHAKLVYCTAGVVLDVAVDLRRGSPTYGRHVTVSLDASRGNLVYIASGLAHGFYTLSDSATMVYNVSSVYSESHDSGILWSSAGIAWPDREPLLSERDRSFVALGEFDSPFEFTQDAPSVPR
jgi:dTDP-4-dehydrorhamnose 3,5-epimerase